MAPNPSLSPPLLERRERGKTAEPNPFWTEPPRPLTSGFVQPGPRKAAAGVTAIMGASEERKGIGRAWTDGDYVRPGCERFSGGKRKETQRGKKKRTLGEVWHSAERVNGGRQRGRREEQCRTDLFASVFQFPAFFLFSPFLYKKVKRVVKRAVRVDFKEKQMLVFM